jgi:RNA polymerase sigma factor (sigma-70 family)
MSSRAEQVPVRTAVTAERARASKPAFEEVLRELRDWLVVQVRALSRRQLDASDVLAIVGDVMWEMQKKYSDYDPERAPVRAWAYGFCRLLVRKHFDEANRDLSRRERYAIERAEASQPNGGSNADERILLRQLLNELDDDVREAVIAKEIGGFTYEEVQALMRASPWRWECSLTTVHNRIQAAKELMRRRLEEARSG